MQNNFSKCREWVPRGTSQHKWRWLTTLLLILTLGIGQMWADTYPQTVWSADVQAIDNAQVTITKGRSSDAFVENTGLSWASQTTYPYRLNVGGSNAATITAQFKTDLTMSDNHVLRVYWGGTSARNLNLTINTGDAFQIGTTNGNLSQVVVSEYEFTSAVELNKFVLGVSGGSTYIFKLEIVNLGPKPTTGSTTISYSFPNNAALTTDARTNNRMATIGGLSSAVALAGGLTSSSSDKASAGCTAKIEGHSATNDGTKYADLQFTISDDYTFTPTALTFKWRANSSSMNAKVVITDGTTTLTSNESTSNGSKDHTENFTFASEKLTGDSVFSGTVHIKVFMYGIAGKRSYLEGPFEITGTVASAAPKYDVVFANGGEGTGDMATLKYKAGEEVTLPACGYTPVSGREFNGWTSSDVTISAGKFEMPAKNVTITATWRDEAVKYTVTYDVNGGSSATPTETDKAAGDEFALAAAPEYDGYHFEGWLCNADAVTYDAEDAYTMTAANTTFTAQWKPYSTISIANKTYIIGIGDFNAVSDFSSNSDGEVTYALKEAYTGVTLSNAGVFSATVAGEYIVVANQAGDATYAATSKEFTVTVLDNELSDIYIWSKASKYGGDGKCISATDANKDANANAASTTLNYSALAMDGMTSMGRPGGDAVVTLTFSVKGDYSSLFGIKSICAMGKLEEPAGGQISWDNGTTWTALDAYGSGDGEVKTFNAPTGVFPASFKIKFVSASTSVGGLYWRNALVTLEAKKTVTSTDVELNNVKVNGTAISGSDLSSLLTNKTLDIATVYTTAPTVTFVKRTTVNYAGGWPADETDENIDVDATDATTNWSASQLINENNYTVTLAKPTVPSLITEATGFTLTSTKVAKDTEKFTFSGMNLTSGNVTIALESAVAGMTVSPAEVTPTEGVITDQEVTITYKSVEDVAEANVNLVVYYDADTKIVLPLTYSSTAGIVDLTPISASTTWNWDHANSSTDAIESLDANEIVVFANYSGWVDAFKANSIAGKLQYVYRGNNYAQGHNLKFNTTVPGIVTVTFSNTSTKEVARAPRITDVNGSYAPTDEADGAKTADKKSYSHAVAAGDVLIEGFEMREGTPANMLRFYEVRFVPTFSVTYMPNGGTGAEYIDDNATEVAEGTLFTAPASSAFVEWNTQADGNGDAYAPGDAVTADLTLFAQWETSYTVTFDLQGHGDAIDPQNIVSGGKVTKPADPSADEWEFGGWYKESTCENEWDFATDVVTTTTTIFAKWTADPCPTPFSLSKVVLTSASDGTVTGYNNDEYAGEKVIGGLNSTETADVDPSHEGTETGYKLNSGGSAIVFATLKKGKFQVGDRVVVTITKAQDAYEVEEVAQPILDIYCGTDKNDATFLTTIDNVTAAGSYTYRLTAADVTAIGSKKGIGVFRPSSGRTQNPFVYSVEIKGCREWAIFHTLTFKNIDGTATIAAESLEEGAYASTVAPAAPKITLKRFLGWAEATDGTPVDLTTYTITENKILYAVYEDIDCSATGVKFSMTPKANELTENYEPKGDEERDYAEYATLVGGKVFINNVDASNKRISVLKETSHIKLEGGDDGYIHVELDCPLNEKDTIKIENDQKWKVSVAKGSGYVAKVKADKYHVVPAAWDGKYDFYIKRDGSSLTISGIQVVRPAKFDVSFNMMGHGTQIADIEDVIDGSKIAAPTAPTDEDYSFAGWYKEITCENEWKFDVDVVETNTTLYAKWLDKSDATLKSLKYGETEIALENGVSTYAVNLSPLATDVPALTAVPSNPNATAVVTNATALDSEGHATSTVVVTPEVGAAKTYTVNFTKVHLYTELVDVTGHTEWSWVGMSTQEIDKANEIGTILANYVIGNHFEKIEGKADEHASRSTDGGVYQGTYLKFHTTVPGAVTVTYRGTGNSSNVTLTIGTEQLETYAGGFTDSKKVIVPAGDVKITSEGTMRVQKIVFQTLDEVTPDYSRPVTIDRMGTVCVDHNVPAGCFIGAEVYRLLYWKYGTSYADCLMVDFEEVDEMEAGNPYLIIPTEETFKLYYGGVKDETPNEVNHFIGTYNPIAQGTEGDAILMGKYGVVNNQIRLLGSGAYSPANRAYIDLENLQSKEEYEAANPSNPAPKKRISLSREGAAVATGLDAINVDTETVQKVMIDGQMYIIRGGHIFTVSGNLVK